MNTFKLFFKKRLEQFVRIYSFYKRNSYLSKSAKNNFPEIVKDGKLLVKEISLLKDSSEIQLPLRNRIENYLIATEEAIYAVGIELESDTSELLAVLDDFKNMRLLLLLYVDGVINDSNFI